MKSFENSGLSVKSDSFSTAVKVLTLILGVGVVIAAVCVYALTQGCGSDSGNSAPIYDENGNCLNCGGNGDASATPADGYYLAGDSCNGDTCSTQPQYDTVVGACEAIKAGKKPPKVCMPWQPKHTRCLREKELQGGVQLPCESQNKSDCACAVVVSDDGWFNPKCVPDEYCDPHDWYTCATDSDCQVVPCDAWPPEVCWDFCGFFGEWDCGSSVLALTFFPDNGGGLCHIQSGDGTQGRGQGYNLLGKPGDPNPRYPLDGEPKSSFILSPDGQTLIELTGQMTCTRL